MAGWLMTVLIGGLVALMPVTGHTTEYTVGPAPAWVVPTTPGVSGADQVSQGSDGVAYLLTDTQMLAGDQQRVTYHRLVSTALNASGVDSVANIQIPFDPSYQTLVLHAINIVRDGRVIPKLAKARIQVIQREAELEARIYDGAKTVNVFLDDVRVGDTIDYAYSTTGRNPVFKGLDFGTMWLQFGTPVARIHTRLLLPLNKSVTFAEQNTAIKAVVSEHDGLRDYVWDVVDPPALTIEKGAPDWYLPFARVAWSEFPDWAAVARWAQPLYQVPATLSPALQVQVNRIAKTETTPTGQMLAALRLVQSEVRYLGVEIGQNSHAPNAPAVVFTRRFGDCKDKTLLTLTLLEHLGIEAHAALVNTRLQRGLTDVLPNPSAFDHVLVQANIEGKIWWIDPTRPTQQADLDNLFQPDFGLALIVGPGTQGLTDMKRSEAASSASRSLYALFDASAGFDKPVPYTVETTTKGESAEWLRATLSSINRVDLQKNYLNFYANNYPHITVAAPLQVRDDEQSNSIIIGETYVIADMSSPSDDDKRRVAGIHMPDIVRVLRDPEVTIRKSPLRLAYPLDVSQRTEVLLPGEWPIKPSSTTIDDPAFRFEQTEKLRGRRLIITDHFQGLTDEVPAKDMARYLGNLARARAVAGYELSWGKPVATTTISSGAKASALDRMNWPVALLALGMFGFWTWLAVVTYRYDPTPSNTQDNRWVGIDGWLLVLAVVLALKPLVYGYSLTKLVNLMSIDKWSVLTTYGSSRYSALWAPVLLFELAAALAQLVFSLLVLLLFFQRRSSFPRLALLLLLAAIVLRVSDHMLVSLLHVTKGASTYIEEMVGSVIGVAIWSAYLLLSQRVKSTFVRRYRVSAAPPLSPSLPQAVDRTSAGEPMIPAAITDSD
ncbi:MAG: DUF3857 domain-containing protein [Rhodanobacter sp.]